MLQLINQSINQSINQPTNQPSIRRTQKCQLSVMCVNRLRKMQSSWASGESFSLIIPQLHQIKSSLIWTTDTSYYLPQSIHDLSDYLPLQTVPAPHTSVRPYPWPTGQQKHTFIKNSVSSDKGAPPLMIWRTRPPSRFRILEKMNLEKHIGTDVMERVRETAQNLSHNLCESKLGNSIEK